MANVSLYKPDRMLSSSSASEVTFWVRQKIDEGVQHLLVDLRNVMFMDSSGLGCLVAARRMALETGATFALCSLNGQAKMLFELAGVEDLFLIVDGIKAYEELLDSGVGAVPEQSCA